MQPFENVREQLLKAGIAAVAVNRYIVELREHLADLTAKERASETADANGRARNLMGSDAQLVQAMIERGAPRALSVKAPWAVFGLLPVVAIVAVAWLVAMSMMRLLMPVRAMVPSDMPGGYQTLVAAAGIFTGYLLGPLLTALCIATALRQRLSSAWVWVGLGLIALFSGFFAFHAPSSQHDMYRATTVVMSNGHVDGAATLALVTVRAATLFVLAAFAWRILKNRQSSVA